MFTAVCPHCFCTYDLADSLMGKRATCKECRKVFLLEESIESRDTVVQTTLFTSDSSADFELQQPSSASKQSASKKSAPKKTTDKKQPETFTADSGLWNVGDVILGVYEVKPIAEGVPHAAGGVGVVHRIYHREWDMDLAVKSPKPQFFQTEHGKRSYEQEAQTWIELGLHPNIVTCYLVRRIGGIPRLFAEFVPDGSLRDWMLDGRLYHGGKSAALLRILNVAIQFAWGLDHAHRQSLLHLDVKPANVMMSEQTAKVTDFGLAQTAMSGEKEDGESDNYITVGMTPGYCSPEQYLAVEKIKKQEFEDIPKMTVQTDMWSWAVSVLGMFLGGPPCNKEGGQNARKVCQQFLNSMPPEKCPVMPDAIAELLMHCFEPEPANRPPSMEQIADRLTQIYKEVAGTEFPRPKPINATWTPDSINNRAISLLDLNKPEEAAKLFNQAIVMQPWHPAVTYNRTIISWRLAQLTDRGAVEQLETLIKMRPQMSGAVYGLGLAHRERGNLTSALDALNDALVIEDRDDIRRAIAAAEKKLADEARCLDYFTLADTPARKVFVEGGGEFILCYTEPQTLAHYSTITGQLRRTFKIPNVPPKEGERLALSSDLFWELYAERNGFLIRRVGPPHETFTFRQINWGRKFNTEEATRQVLLLDKAMLGTAVRNRVDITNIETQKKIGSLLGHEGNITALAFNSDGRFAITAGDDRTVRLWELPLCRCLRTFTVPKQTIDALYLDPNGHFALSATAGGVLRLWSVAILCRPKAFRAPLQLSLVTSAEEAGRQQSEMEQLCHEIRQSVRQNDYAAALHWIEKAKTRGGWESARYSLEIDGIGDTLRRRTVRESFDFALCTHRLSGHQDAVTSLAISLDANLIASAGRDGEIRVWNIAEQRCVANLEGHRDEVRSIAMTADAKFVLSGSRDGTVRIWNIETEKSVRKFSEKLMTLTKIALHPHGKIIAIADGAGTVLLWDVLSNSVTTRWTSKNGGISALQFSRDGHYLAAGGSEGTVTIWKRNESEPLCVYRDHPSPVTTTALTVDGIRCFSADRSGQISIRNLQTNKQERKFQEHIGEISGLEVLADSRFLFSASKDETVKVWSLTEPMATSTIEGHPAAITAMRLEISGRRLVTGDADGVVRVWELLWNHHFPGWQPVSAKAKSVLASLLSFHLENKTRENGAGKLKMDEATINRILLEMDYCGFGTIPQESLRQTMDDLLSDLR